MLTSLALLAAALPFSQAWSDTGLISRDDDWAGVASVVGYRGDGLTEAPGADPRSVVADGSSTPLDVNANEADPGAVGLAAGVTEFELADPVVALQGSATAAAPHLVLSLDTRGRSGVTVRYRLRDVDGSGSNAVQAVALQYRVGSSGQFATVPGGFVADATSGPGAATLVTPVSAVLPAAAEDEPLVQLRILTTNAVGQDEWVGVDDIEVEASGSGCVPPVPPPPGPGPTPHPGPGPTPPAEPGPTPPAGPPPALPPHLLPPALTGLTVSPATFTPAKRGPAVTRTGRTGASLRFHLSRPATVEFRVTTPRLPDPSGPRTPAARAPLARHAIGRSPVRPPHTYRQTGGFPVRSPLAHREIGRFFVRGRRGTNRLRFTGRLRGRRLPAGPYRLTAQATDRDGLTSSAASTAFRVR
jgi:hypothetical protein